jgi:hypothetical protein
MLIGYLNVFNYGVRGYVILNKFYLLWTHVFYFINLMIEYNQIFESIKSTLTIIDYLKFNLIFL